jgi:hypothetical protein
MEIKPLPLSTPCPCCQQRMVLAALRCDSCGVKIEGPVQAHEFMFLSEEDLQFLRIFIQFEGRIRDMEAPLGLSYPTIRNRIADFKERMFNASTTFFQEAQKKKTPDEKKPIEILSDLEDGNISFEEALAAIQKKRKKK